MSLLLVVVLAIEWAALLRITHLVVTQDCLAAVLYGGTRPYHVFMVQSRDQWLENSGTALASGYHNFVQIKALWKKMGLRKTSESWMMV